MSLLTLRNKIAQITGQSPTDDQTVIDMWINTEAERLYRENDFPDCLAESTLKVSESSFIALPSYVGQLRGVRENRWLRKWQITSMFPRYVSTPNWDLQKGWRAWRVIGRSPCMVNLSGDSPIILTTAGLDQTVIPTVTIKGSTGTSHNYSETVIMNALVKQTLNTYLPNPVSIVKNAPNTYDIVGTDIYGNILFVLNNDEVESKYIIVNIQGYPWKGCQSDVSRTYRCVDVLYKKTFRKMIADGDTFICGSEYEDLIADQVCGFWAEQSDKIQKTLYYYGKVQAQLKSIFEDKTGGEEHRMHFAPSGFFGWFDMQYGQPAGDLCCASDDCCDETAQILGASTVIPPQARTALFYNTEQSFTTGCPLDTEGEASTATIAANTYNSYVSQEAANITASLAAKAAAIAALNCSASPNYWNTEQSFTASCGAGLTGNSIQVTIPANSYSNKVSQESIDAFALAQATLQANEQLVCIAPESGCIINLGKNGVGNYDEEFTIAALGADLDVILTISGDYSSINIYANSVLIVPVGDTYTLPAGTTEIGVAIAADVGSTFGYSLQGTVTPALNGNVSSFNFSNPVGTYMIRYKEGTMLYGNPIFGHGWKVNYAPEGVNGYGFRILHSDDMTEIEFPVNTYFNYPTQAEGQAGNAGASVTFNHASESPIKMKLFDFPYGDNIAGNPSPTFELYKKSDGAWQWSLTCDPIVCLVLQGSATPPIISSDPPSGVLQPVPVNLGTFVAGNYRVVYQSGVWAFREFEPDPAAWHVNKDVKIKIIHSNGDTTIDAPGLDTEDSDPAVVEALNAGQYVDFVHAGGTIQLQVQDAPTQDNQTPLGYTSPTYNLYKNNCPE